MGENPLPSTPMEEISADLIGPLTESVNGNRYALTVICLCSGWCEVYPIKDKTNQSVWTKFAIEFIPRHGAPETLITDRGRKFNSFEFDRYLAIMGIAHNVTNPVHPCSNGKIEHFNRVLKDNKFINDLFCPNEHPRSPPPPGFSSGTGQKRGESMLVSTIHYDSILSV